MIVQNFLILIGLYIAVIFFIFAWEYSYKKKNLGEIKKSAKGIIYKITILFAVIVISSYIFGLLGIKPG